MQASQQATRSKISRGASYRHRAIAAIVFLLLAGLFAFLYLAQVYGLDIGRWFAPCGFKQRYGLPCPTCGMTTAVLAFSRGDILEAFYAQPAGALFCSVAVLTAFLALLVAVFALNFSSVGRSLAQVKARYLVLIVIVVVAAGWAVTLARALAMR